MSMRDGNTSSFLLVENVTQQRVIARHVRSAAGSSERRRGLLGVNELESDDGLWINPCEAIHTFGMAMPLDVIFLDACMRVKRIAAFVKPNRIAFCLTANSVLEMKAGTATASGIQCGDQLLFRLSPESPEQATAPVEVIR